METFTRVIFQRRGRKIVHSAGETINKIESARLIRVIAIFIVNNEKIQICLIKIYS